MPRTAYSPDGRASAPWVSRYEVGDDGTPSPIAPVLDDDPGAGGLCAPAVDLARFLQRITGPDPVVGAETLAEMMRPQAAFAGLGGMGLGFQCVELDGLELRGHSGNTDGASSALFVVPDQRTGVAVLTNCYTLGMPGLAAKALVALCAPAEPPRANRRPRGGVSPLAICGPYRPRRGVRSNIQTWAYLGGELNVVARPGRLALRAASPFGPFNRAIPLELIDEAPSMVRYRLEIEGVPLTAAFIRGHDGWVTALNFGGLLGFFSLRRRPWITGIRLSLTVLASVVACAVGTAVAVIWS
jgi:hypothetical protein